PAGPNVPEQAERGRRAGRWGVSRPGGGGTGEAGLGGIDRGLCGQIGRRRQILTGSYRFFDFARAVALGVVKLMTRTAHCVTHVMSRNTGRNTANLLLNDAA